MSLFFLWFACASDPVATQPVPTAPTPTSAPTPVTPLDTAPPTAPPLPDGLHGQAPAVALSIPSFSATANTGAARGPEALLGHVTVLWFLPAANTGG